MIDVSTHEALIAAGSIEPHMILRRKLFGGKHVTVLARLLEQFCDRAAFGLAELFMKSGGRRRGQAFGVGNANMPAAIFEDRRQASGGAPDFSVRKNL